MKDHVNTVTQPSLAKVFWSPQSVFGEVEKIRLRHILVVILAVQFLIAMINIPAFNERATAAIAQLPTNMAHAKYIIVAVAAVFSALVVPLLIALMSGLFFLVGAINGRYNYRGLFCMLSLACFPIILASAIKSVVGIVFGAEFRKGNVLSFARVFDLDQSTILGKALGFFDLFDFWTFVLVMIGFSIVSGLRRLPAYALAALLWGLLQLVLFRLELAAS